MIASSSHSRPSRPQGSSVSPVDFVSHRSSPHRGSEVPETGPTTIMPSMLDGTDSDASNYNHSTTYPPQTTSQAHSVPLSSWLNLPQSVTDSRPSYNYTTEPSFTVTPVQTSSGALDLQKLIKQEIWGYESHHAPAYSSTATSPLDYDFQPTYGHPGFTRTTSMQRPFLLLSNGREQQLPWCDSTIADTLNEIPVDPRAKPPNASAFDAVDSSGPSIYSTTTEPHLSVQPMKRLHRDVDDALTVDSYETDSESAKGEPPYAKLIYDALMDAPEHKLVLRDIYTWISDNTDKAKDPGFKGWQNSVRHNLSMNGAFRKVPYVDPANKHKKGFIWVLEPSAVGKGIESTTRYRQKTIGKRSDNSEAVDPKRQRSGRKGGRAARKSTKFRKFTRLDDHDPRNVQYFENRAADYALSSPVATHRTTSPNLNHYHMGGLPYYVDHSNSQSPLLGELPCNYAEIATSAGLTTDPTLFSNSFNDDDDFLGSKSEDLFGGQGLTALA